MAAPDRDHAQGRYAIPRPPPPARRLTGEQVAYWIVAGASVTGLATRRLGELHLDRRNVLIDESLIGYGSSRRSADFIIDTPHPTEQLDGDTNRQNSRLVPSGLAELPGLLRRGTGERHDVTQINQCGISFRTFAHPVGTTAFKAAALRHRESAWKLPFYSE